MDDIHDDILFEFLKKKEIKKEKEKKLREFRCVFSLNSFIN